jgi:protein-tyrosine phosphatase
MPTTSRLLFLCSGNYYRSRFAEACFNFHAAEQGLAWRAESRGFRLSPKNVGPISPHAVDGLIERGIPLGEPERMPRVATETDLADSQLVVALKEDEHRPLMQQRFATWVDRIEYWRIHDIDFAEPQVALSQLEREIRELVSRLGSPTDAARRP